MTAPAPVVRRADPSTVFWRFYVGQTTLIAVVAVVMAAIAVRHQRTHAVSQAKVDLNADAVLIRDLVGDDLIGDAAVRQRVRRIASDLTFEFALLDANGRVVADTTGDAPDVASQAGAPEIRDAAAHGFGTDERRDPKSGLLMVYTAVPLFQGGARVGFVRTSDDIAQIEADSAILLRLMALSSAALLLGTALLGLVFTRRLQHEFRASMAAVLERDALFDRVKANEEALSRANDELSRVAAIVSSSDDAVFSKDRDGIVLTWNQGAERMFRWPADAIVGRSVDVLIPPEHRDDDREMIGRVVGNRAVERLQTRRLRHDGSWFDALITMSPIMAASGDATAVAVIVRDVSERVRAEAALQASEERLQLALKATSEAIWDWDPAAGTMWWNDQFYALIGSDAATVAPSFELWRSHIVTEDRAAVEAGFREFVASDRSVWATEYRFARANGSHGWAFDRAYVVRDGLGTPRRMIGSVMDVTDRKEAERMKSDFVSFASHQLRTPLSGMNWMLELAQEAPGLPPDARDYITEARASAARLVTLVNDLLDVSRLESGRLTVTLAPVDIGSLTRAIIDEAQGLTRDKRQHVALQAATAPPVAADEQLLRQAMTNLLSNAIKYTPTGGHIDVALEQHNGFVQWAVTDSGIGVPASAQPHLFEKFYRADNAVAAETEGTGLGLHLVRLIVEQFGGRVWWKSEEGKGATFGFALPATGRGL